VYLSNFNAKFYTVNAENFFIRKTQDNVISAETEDNDTEYYIKLDWNELVTLGEGVLQYKIVNNVPDSDRADLYFNKNLERSTEYYINSNVTVDPESEQSYAEIIAELGVKIDTEIARSTSADTVHDEAIQDEVITRQQNVSDLTDLISSNTSGITQNRSDISDLSAAIANEITERTTNYYTKTDVDNAIAAIDVSEQLADYLKISAFTQAEQTINNNINAVSGSVGTKLAKSDFNTYSAATNTRISDINGTLQDICTGFGMFENVTFPNYTAETETKINSKLDASAYTPTDLSGYYTKSEVDDKIDDIDISSLVTDLLKVSDFNSYSADTNTTIVSNEVKSGNGITANKSNSGTTLQITYIDAGDY
jgi:hypothetical protein